MNDVARLRFVGAVVASAMAACASPAAPVAMNVAPVDAGEERDAAVDAPVDANVPDVALPDVAAPSITSGWVFFDGPLYVTETPMHGGPDWHIRSAKLPAWIRSSRTLVLPDGHERGISSVPNFEVRFSSADGAHVKRTVTILSEKEFDTANAAGSDVLKREAFAALGETVRARIAALHAELDALAGDVTSLEECAIDPADSSATWPPCSGPQTLTCGAMKLRYLGGKQTLETPHGVKHFPSWRKPGVAAGEGVRIPVNECVSSAWFVGETRTLALVIDNECGGAGGDWCFVESDWRFVHVAP